VQSDREELPVHDERNGNTPPGEARKRELEQKYGASFPGESPDVPSARGMGESRPMDLIDGRTTVRRFLGNPTFVLWNDVAGEDREKELGHVLEYLALHGVSADFLTDVPLEDRYRFVTEELLDREMDDVRLEGSEHHFLYEEFHPNDLYEAMLFAEDFLHFVLDGNVRFAMNGLSKEELWDASGVPTTIGMMGTSLREFTGRIMTFVKKDVACADCRVEGDSATVCFRVNWSGLMAESLKTASFSGLATLRMKRSSYGGWDVVQAVVPGWNA